MKRLIICLVAACLLTACDENRPVSSANIEQVAQEDQQLRLITAQPAPKLDVSMERKNLADRLQRLNTENMSGYIYLVSYGQVMAFYPVKGKVTSLNSYLSGDQKPAYFGRTAKQNQQTSWMGWQMVESPDYDGAYGKNSDGIFFFTADSNAYVEWHGDYLFSDQPLKLATQAQLIREIK